MPSAAREMVGNTIQYLPEKPPGGDRESLRVLSRGGSLTSDPFWLGEAVADAAAIQSLLDTIRRDEAAIAGRIAWKLAPHCQGECPGTTTIYLVVGGGSDGFVVDGDGAPHFFVAIDKSGGDLAGLKQDFTHESVHLPQRTSIEKQPPVERFLTTSYEEGVGNYLADPAELSLGIEPASRGERLTSGMRAQERGRNAR
jgi:hypothetical protein